MALLLGKASGAGAMFVTFASALTLMFLSARTFVSHGAKCRHDRYRSLCSRRALAVMLLFVHASVAALLIDADLVDSQPADPPCECSCAANLGLLSLLEPGAIRLMDELRTVKSLEVPLEKKTLCIAPPWNHLKACSFSPKSSLRGLTESP